MVVKPTNWTISYVILLACTVLRDFSLVRRKLSVFSPVHFSLARRILLSSGSTGRRFQDGSVATVGQVSYISNLAQSPAVRGLERVLSKLEKSTTCPTYPLPQSVQAVKITASRRIGNKAKQRVVNQTDSIQPTDWTQWLRHILM